MTKNLLTTNKDRKTIKITSVTLDERDVLNIRIALASQLVEINKKIKDATDKAKYLLRNQKTLEKFEHLQYVEITTGR